MEVDIDKLNIEISGNADKAEKSIDKLTDSLSRLKDVVSKNTGLNKLSKQLAKLHETSQQLSGLKAHMEKVNAFSESIYKLSGLKIPSVTKMRNRIKDLVNMSHEMAAFKGSDKLVENINEICSAMKPMENMGKNSLAPFVNSLNKISDVTKKMDNKALQDFRNMIKEITSAIQPLITQVSKSEKGLVSLNRIIQSTVSSNGNLASSNAAAVKSYTSVSSVLTSTKAKLVAYGYALSRAIRVAKEWVDLSNDYIENLNLFSVAMGDEAQSALNYANTVNKALGIDVSDWIRNQGVFKQVTSGFGVLNDKSNIMSKNLTQLGYDISSFFNIDVDESMQKLQSGISGEIEPLRRLGYALDQSTLQQIAYANGITTNINKMTQAQKSQLRYIAILQQSKNVMGDMARTVTTPANAMRILDQQFTQLKRSIGNIISIVVQKLLPYIQAFVRLLGEAADYLAKLWGFELPKIDYSNVGNGLSNISDEADNATESVKKTAKQIQNLAGFDELNILSFNDNSSSDNSDISPNNFDLGIDMPEYDFLGEMDKQTDSIYKNMKKKLLELITKFQKLKQWVSDNYGWLKQLGILLADIWAFKKLMNFVGWIKKLWGWSKKLTVFTLAKKWVKAFLEGIKTSEATTAIGKLSSGFKNATGKIKTWRQQLSPATKLLGVIAGSALSGVGSYNLFKDLAKDTGSWKTILADSAMIVGGLGASWIFGGGVGLAVGGIVTVFAGLYGYLSNVKTEAQRVEEEYAKLTPEQDELAKKVDEAYQKFKESHQNMRDSVSDANGDYTYYKNLWDELQGIVDQNGHIKEGYQDRAKVITDELNEALGLNIELINKGEIKAYQNLQSEIDKVIQKKRTEATLDAMKSGYVDAKNAQNQALVNYSTAINDYNNQKMEVDRIKEQQDQYQKELSDLVKRYEGSDGEDMASYSVELNQIKGKWEAKGFTLDEMGNFAEYKGAKKKLDQLSETLKEAEEVMVGYNSTIQQYEELSSAMVSGDADKITQALKNVENGFISCTAGTESTLKEQVKNAQENYYNLRESLRNGVQGITQEQVNEAKAYVDKTTLELAKFNFNSVKNEYSNGKVYTGKQLNDIKKKSEDSLKEIKQLYKDKAPGITKSMVDEMDQLNRDVGTRIQTLKNTITDGMSFDTTISFEFATRPKEIQEFVDRHKSWSEKHMPSSIPHARAYGEAIFNGYASGGFPDTGQLFVARENGIPEMVGKIGNQTAVANNDQIEKGIADAVYKAVTSASGSSVANNNQPINITVPVYLDGQKMDEQSHSYRQRQLVRSNGKRTY